MTATTDSVSTYLSACKVYGIGCCFFIQVHFAVGAWFCAARPGASTFGGIVNVIADTSEI